MRHHDDDKLDQADCSTKKPYEAPAIVDRAEFETLALACGKTDPIAQPSCYGPGQFTS